MAQNSYKYYAFISYNSKDIEWGKRIQRKLEHYRMPATLCSERGWKRTPINPVFFAPSDIQPRELNEEIRQRLRDSRNLIVVCSPNSAKSEWVGKEIAFFYELGRTDNIHFFIVDGIPNSGDKSTECFNPVLKNLGLKEKLGANINEQIYRWPLTYLNKERAYIQLISVLLDVEFDSLWKRHRRQLISKLLMLAAMSLIIMTAFVWVWAKNQPKEINVTINETSVVNDSLPPLENAIISLQLENETKSDTLLKITDNITFSNIPHKYLNSEVNVTFACENYLPLDTTLLLSESITLNVERNPHTFGDVQFTLWDSKTEQFAKNADVAICGIHTKTDADGVAKFFIPLNLQNDWYIVESSLPLQSDTLQMPCGTSSYLFLKN